MGELGFVPDWEEDETLYSWCARFHHICGNGSARHTSAALFGTEHAVREHDAPAQLGHFVEATHGTLGSVETILRARTVAGQFWPFIGDARQSELRKLFVQGSSSGWTSLMGMPASGLITRSLRFCPKCVRADGAAGKVPRWRMAHQLAGGVACMDHGCMLIGVTVRASRWVLPPNAADVASRRYDAVEATARDRVALQTLAALAWRCIGVERVDLAATRDVILQALREQGISSWKHPLDRDRVTRWFRGTRLAAALRRLQTRERLLADGVWVHDLLRRRRGEHPLLWLTLWCAANSGQSVHDLAQGLLFPCSRPVTWDISGQGCIWPASDVALPASVDQVILQANSLKQAAKELGISVLTLRRQLEILGCHGGNFRGAARAHELRMGAISKIENFMRIHPTCSRTDVHHACKAAVAWLGRHAPEELTTLLLAIPERRPRQLLLQLS